MRALSCAAAIALFLQPSFKTSVQLVTVPVVVTTTARDQLIMSGLTAADFRVFEDGVPQEVAVFSQDRQPTSLCVVADASGSMATAHRIDLGVTALQNAVRALDPDDEIAVVRFAGRTTTLMPWTRRPEPGAMKWRLDSDPGTVANSSITDAVEYALRLIDRASKPRRAMLVISDGYENTSVTPLARVVKTRAQSETLVYAFNVAGPVERAPTGGNLVNILPQVVGDSGGVMLNVSSLATADEAALTLVNELKFQYTIGYESTRPMDGAYRRIKVEIAVPGLVARHRGGYLAQRAQ